MIKMCEEAKEIQKQWTPSQGDWFYKQDGIGFGLWVVCYIENGILLCAGEKRGNHLFDDKLVEFRLPEMYIWLPRQDDLQKMVDNPIEFATEMFYSLQEFGDPFYNYTGNVCDKRYWKSIKTMEQLWLSLIMKDKYNKKWNGDIWQ